MIGDEVSHCDDRNYGALPSIARRPGAQRHLLEGGAEWSPARWAPPAAPASPTHPGASLAAFRFGYRTRGMWWRSMSVPTWWFKMCIYVCDVWAGLLGPRVAARIYFNTLLLCVWCQKPYVNQRARTTPNSADESHQGLSGISKSTLRSRSCVQLVTEIDTRSSENWGSGCCVTLRMNILLVCHGQRSEVTVRNRSGSGRLTLLQLYIELTVLTGFVV